MWVNIIILAISLVASALATIHCMERRVTQSVAVMITLEAKGPFSQGDTVSGIVSVLDNIVLWQVNSKRLQALADEYPSPLWLSEVLPCVDGEARELLIESIILNNHEKILAFA